MGKFKSVAPADQAATPEKVFGQVIKERRLRLGLTQLDLEGEDGLERSYISRLETGQYQVCLRGILHLARMLDTTSAELMDEVEQQLQKKTRKDAD